MDRERVIEVRVADDGESVRVLSPAVGIWKAIPPDGTLIGPGSNVGRLVQLNRKLALELPEGVAGRIELADARRARALSYGEVMFHLSRISDDRTDRRSPGSDNAPGELGEGGVLALRAPTDGVFYLRPAPDAEAFVKVGQKIRRGQPVGLIEVMKTFNQVLYEGSGLPDEGTVAEVRVEDGTEVSAGQPLLVVH